MIRAYDSRLSNRKNMFVVAQLSWENGNAPVRIRNISSVGALLEGAGIPSIDTRVTLSRGAHSVPGQIVWMKGQQVGFEALEPIVPDDWLPMHSRTRKGDISAASADHQSSSKASTSHLNRDHIMAENLIRIRAMVEDVRVRLSTQQGVQQTDQITTTLDHIHRLLTWQVGELQS
ncbi:hypothetical protein G7077_08060 [Sphingomonas piscis]|uniref:PilZ domain-containing protein n=1 Tax=Sphingomonas piscis TaxID=2714943 RepID=A0A6G7YQ42_9SPHN|nr:hypothetical protein [Sphingomonas piscis]QIK78854.1 hypothetical protein G7077_08060 [Sphingomonas piscis]